MSFDLLSEPIRKYVRDKRWEQLRPIQTAAIERILTTENNYILASRTASGKTEAAFLPILSKIDFNTSGVKVLYISPLIALINDQFFRIEELCKYLDVNVTKWHGEANRSLKNKLLKDPNGIVLITPESLEAMFVNHPYNIKHLFSQLEFVVIDEIHSFIGTDRGMQLKSLLYRLQEININRFKIVGLSATIGDYVEAKKFTGDEPNTKVLVDKEARAMNAEFGYFKDEGEDLPLDLLKEIYIKTKDSKVLIFPNSRGRAEEIAVKLKKISDKVKGHSNYFSHHSSIDKEVREFVEHFAKTSFRQNFCISCTSTLELGIDIGSIDMVVQVDATHSIASLIQRVGRSGRRDGAESSLVLYATDEWSLVQSLACWLLYKDSFIEPPLIVERPYDILLHQALSIVKGRSGIVFDDLIGQLQNNFAFSSIIQAELLDIVTHLIKIDFFEKLDNEIIIGIEGERVVNHRDFYSVFQSEENYKVINAGTSIGEIPLSPQIREDENILLAARIWKIVFIDTQGKKIEVKPAKDGKKPKFNGTGGTVHPRIKEKMLEIIFCKDNYPILGEVGSEQLGIFRQEFSAFKINNLVTDRPLLIGEKDLDFYTFTGTRINRTLELLISCSGVNCSLGDEQSTINIETTFDNFKLLWDNLGNLLSNIDNYIEQALKEDSRLLGFSKWGKYLPQHLQVSLVREKYFDTQGALHYLQTIKPIPNKVLKS